jgi:hypothetical protein
MMQRFSIKPGLLACASLTAMVLLGAAASAQPAKPAKPAARVTATIPDEAPTTPPDEPMTIYVIKKGDTLWGLADKFFIRRPTYEEVRIRNKVKYVRRMAVGLQLLIPTRLLKTDPIDAHVGAYRGDVTITGLTGPLAAGSVVREGAVVTTGANAFARLDLPDGSRLAVPSQSRVRLEILHRVRLTGAVERTFAVDAGRTESTVAPITAPQDNYYVRTPVSVSAVRGTDFRVGYEAGDKAATTGVVEGTVKVNAPQGGQATVPAKFGIGVKPGVPLNVVPLLPAPGVIDAGRIQDRRLVVFQVDGVEGAKAYRMQLGPDAGLEEQFAEQTHDATKPEFDFEDMTDGNFFLRVTAIDPAGIEGLPRVYAFERALNILTPNGMDIQGAKGDRHYLFKWIAEGEGQRVYRFEIAREPSGDAPLIDEGGLKDPQVTITNLPPGNYRWRVMSTTVRKGRTTEIWSPPQKFTIPAN